MTYQKYPLSRAAGLVPMCAWGRQERLEPTRGALRVQVSLPPHQS